MDGSLSAGAESLDGYRVMPAALRDLRAVRRLEKLIFAGEAYTYPDLLFLFLRPGIINLKLVTPDNALAGFGSGGRLPGSPRVWIISLGIHPDHQRRGLGRFLLEMCEARLSGPTLFLTVRADNERAITLYRRSGYRQIGIRYSYYSDGEDGIEMCKERPWPPGASR